MIKSCNDLKQFVRIFTLSQGAAGLVYLVICDLNMFSIQSMFSLFHKKVGSTSIYFVQHPIAKKKYDKLIYDFVQLFKVIRNNWCI